MVGFYDTVREILIDGQQQSRPLGFQRHLKLERFPRKANVLIGVRRAGKSTYLYQQIQQLIDQGVSKERILYLNFFDDRLRPFHQNEGLSLLLDIYFSLYPHFKSQQKIYCFFDEIQMVPNWEFFIERLLRTEECEVMLTGSSAQMLSREIATQMRGRALSWEIFPFSFAEYLESQNNHSYPEHSSQARAFIQNTFESYWHSGGFAEVFGASNAQRIQVHQEYFHSLLFHDVVERHNVANPKMVLDLTYRLANSISSLYSINSLVGYLKSLGHKTSKASVSHALEWLEDAYGFFSVRRFDASVARSQANPKKIYCIDHALACSVGSGVLVNSGHHLENLVFVELRRASTKVFYYKTKQGYEVDFLSLFPNENRSLIQVCESLENPQTRKRELRALDAAMAELKLSTSMIVTRTESSQEQLESGIVQIVPIWKFLLLNQASV